MRMEGQRGAYKLWCILKDWKGKNSVFLTPGNPNSYNPRPTSAIAGAEPSGLINLKPKVSNVKKEWKVHKYPIIKMKQSTERKKRLSPCCNAPQSTKSKYNLHTWGCYQRTLYSLHCVHKSLWDQTIPSIASDSGERECIILRYATSTIQTQTLWSLAILWSDAEFIIVSIGMRKVYEPPITAGNRVPNKVCSKVLMPDVSNRVWITCALSSWKQVRIRILVKHKWKENGVLR